MTSYNTQYRPQTFADMVGQPNLVGPHGVLTTMANNHTPRSCIFHGNPGTGKTTAAMVLANTCSMPFHTINCTNLSIDGKLPEKKQSLSDLIKSLVLENQKQNPSKPFLFYADEIQYLNRKQQQLFLPYTENGDFILIASTADNPYHEIDKALLSRCLVLNFQPVEEQDILTYLFRICNTENILTDELTLRFLAGQTAGDVRRAVNLLEAAWEQVPKTDEHGQPRSMTAEDIETILPTLRMSHYDKNGDDHYAMKSGLQKSIRGSDPNAAVFYLCRLLEGGDLESACRRLMVIANEDIGLANPDAIPFTYACCEMAKQLGMPEAPKPLTNAVIYLALSRKACTAETAYNAAKADVEKGLGGTIPSHLRNECAPGYVWPHEYPNHWYPQQYLPNDIKDHVYYQPGDNTFEQNHIKYHQMVVQYYREHPEEYLPKNHSHKGD